MINVKLDPEL